jgi:hypothetical protein
MSKFQARHYEAIATVRTNFFPGKFKSELINGLVEMFIRDNPKFKPEKFRKACQ